MPPRARLAIPGIPWHIIQRGNNRSACFHAYVLMTNHVYLLLTRLGQRYVQYINRTYRRGGTLWEGRFRSCLARDEEYVLGCYRYIEINPVRATMVERDYEWTRYRADGEGWPDPLLSPILIMCAWTR